MITNLALTSSCLGFSETIVPRFCRGAGLDPSWLHHWQSHDRPGPSNVIRSVGLSRIQMMMRHLASVGETYAQTALEDTSWSLWLTNPAPATDSDTAFPPATMPGYPGNMGAANPRAARPENDSIANLLAMAETVREDLQRTNSATVTVNNLLQM
ncbi:hypothetical protein Ancab_010279 [Ancistrocladus abbreviatus]